MDEKTMAKTYYVESRRPRYKIYALLLIICVVVVAAFAFTATETGIDTISKKYSERLPVGSDSNAESVTYAMQNLFSETGLILDDASSGLP